jgi:hypothetical protein
MAPKIRPIESSKQKRAAELEKFRHILSALREKFALNEIAQITGIQITNLSAYGSGSKNPSPETIELFYSKLKNEIDDLPKPGKNPKGAEGMQDEPQLFKHVKRPKNITGDLVQNLLINNDRLWTNTEQNSRRFDKIMDNNIKLVDNNTILVNNNTKLIENNNRLVDKVIFFLANKTLPDEPIVSIPSTDPASPASSSSPKKEDHPGLDGLDP